MLEALRLSEAHGPRAVSAARALPRGSVQSSTRSSVPALQVCVLCVHGAAVIRDPQPCRISHVRGRPCVWSAIVSIVRDRCTTVTDFQTEFDGEGGTRGPGQPDHFSVSICAQNNQRITLFYILYSSTLYACFPGLRSPQSGSAAMARFITSMYVCELGAALRGGVGSALGGYFHVYARLDHAHGPALRSKV